MMLHPLDNPVWSALTNGNKNLALGTGSVKYYQPNVAPFAGMDNNTHENLHTLYGITPDENESFAVVSLGVLDIVRPWKVEHRIPLLQMICENPVMRKEITAEIVDLSEEHVPQMLELTHLTNPGPFKEHTIAYGHYKGIFDGGKLVAMAGQRMYAPPYAEISAICTHPDYLGRGYAAQLILSQVNRIRAAAETPFLHVATANERAIKLYESLGFFTRKEMFVYMISK